MSEEGDSVASTVKPKALEGKGGESVDFGALHYCGANLEDSELPVSRWLQILEAKTGLPVA